MRERANWLPAHDDAEWTLVADIVVGDIGYVRTGIRDANGRMILRRVTKPVGFTADHNTTQYAVDNNEPGHRAPTDDDLKDTDADDDDQGEGVEW